MEDTNNDSRFLDSVITTTIQPTPFSITFSWQGDTVKVGQVICSVDTSVKGEAKPKAETLKQVQSDEGAAKVTLMGRGPSFITRQSYPHPIAQHFLE
jgi:hypothetical protein